MSTGVQKYAPKKCNDSGDLLLRTLFRLSHRRCLVWRRNSASLGVESLSHLANGVCVIWRIAVHRSFLGLSDLNQHYEFMSASGKRFLVFIANPSQENID